MQKDLNELLLSIFVYKKEILWDIVSLYKNGNLIYIINPQKLNILHSKEYNYILNLKMKKPIN